MRVAGGAGKGRRLQVPSGLRVRPTSDKVKQALFNILGDKVPGAIFLDLYAGAGGIGIEALSRGAGKVTFVDVSRESLHVIKRNLQQLEFEDRAQVVLSKAESFLKKTTESYDIVFLDPPYAEDIASVLELFGAGALSPGAVVVAEHFKKQASPEKVAGLTLSRESRYGDTVLAFYEMK